MRSVAPALFLCSQFARFACHPHKYNPHSIHLPTHTTHTTLNHSQHTHQQKAKEDTTHAAKTAAIKAESAADSAKHEAKGFGARLWGRGQVRASECETGTVKV